MGHSPFFATSPRSAEETGSGWVIGAQNLGAVLMKAEKYQEAEKIYNQDLDVLRQNGWSLMGLYGSLLAQDKLMEAKKIKREFDEAWKDADIKITTSIL